MIDAFALTGRIVFGGLLPQGVALPYLPLIIQHLHSNLEKRNV